MPTLEETKKIGQRNRSAPVLPPSSWCWCWSSRDGKMVGMRQTNSHSTTTVAQMPFNRVGLFLSTINLQTKTKTEVTANRKPTVVACFAYITRSYCNVLIWLWLSLPIIRKIWHLNGEQRVGTKVESELLLKWGSIGDSVRRQIFRVDTENFGPNQNKII